MPLTSDAVQRALATLSEPTRFRIVTALAERPHTVGEVAEALGALQPQTTKHLQALEAAGVIRIHRLGRRRVASLDHEVLAALADWLAQLAIPTSDDATLRDYADGVAAAEASAASPDAGPTTIRFERRVAAARERVWAAWTDPSLLPRWWAPQHFTVVRSRLDAVPGGRVELRLQEGDGAQYASAGAVIEVDSGRRLVFTLAPLGADGEPLFDAVHEVQLSGETSTLLGLTIRAGAPTAETAAMIAGLEPGWNQLLDALEEVATATPA